MNAAALTASASTFTTAHSTGIQQFNKPSHLIAFSSSNKFPRGHKLAARSTKAPQPPSTYYSSENIKMNQSYQVEMEVQEHEVDHHGTVNDASYASYCKQGHDELLANVASLISGKWEDSAVMDLSVNVIQHLKKGDEFAVKVRVSCVSTRSIFIEYTMHRLQDGEVVAMAESEMVLLDGRYRPISVSQGVRGKFLLLDFQDCAATASDHGFETTSNV